MKKVVPTGEFVLLREAKIEVGRGSVMLAEEAQGDKRYVVENIGAEADTEIEVGDVVFVQRFNLIPVSLDEKTKLFFAKCEYIMGFESEE